MNFTTEAGIALGKIVAKQEPKTEVVKPEPVVTSNFTDLLKNKIGSVDKDKIKFEVSENTITVGFKDTDGEITGTVSTAKKGKADTAVKVTLSAEATAKGKKPEEVIEELVALFKTF